MSMFRRVVQTFMPMQNLDGGFGGGHGQMSHCAASYAAILSLAMVGGKEAMDMIDRRALQVVSHYKVTLRANSFIYRWKWLGELKQDDGGFIMSVEGEEDVRFVSGSFQGSRRYSSFGRGAYSAMLMISLLALPLELPPHAPSRSNGFNLFSDGLPEYLSRCAYHTLLCIALKLN